MHEITMASLPHIVCLRNRGNIRRQKEIVWGKGRNSHDIRYRRVELDHPGVILVENTEKGIPFFPQGIHHRPEPDTLSTFPAVQQHEIEPPVGAEDHREHVRPAAGGC